MTMKTRKERLLPNGIPRYVRCYDNGGKTLDRYTVCFTGRAAPERSPGRATEYPYVGMSAHPFHPQGFGQHGASKGQPCDVNRHGFAPAIGRKCYLGRRIAFADLPPDCQRLVLSDYVAIWKLEGGREVKNANGWKLIPWDGNPALNLTCWRKKFGRGHVSVGIGEFRDVVFSFGANSDDSHCCTRWRKDAEPVTPEQAMEAIDRRWEQKQMQFTFNTGDVK
jgi:hypothetical protein